MCAYVLLNLVNQLEKDIKNSRLAEHFAAFLD